MDVVYVCVFVCVCVYLPIYIPATRSPSSNTHSDQHTHTHTHTHSHSRAAAFWQKTGCKKLKQHGYDGFCISCWGEAAAGGGAGAAVGVVGASLQVVGVSPKKKKLTKREQDVSTCADEETLWVLWNRFKTWAKPVRVTFIKRLNTFRKTQLSIDSAPHELKVQCNLHLMRSKPQ